MIHGDANAALHAARKFADKGPITNAIAGEIGINTEKHSIHLGIKHLPGAANVDLDALIRLRCISKSIPSSLHNVLRVSVPKRDRHFLQAAADILNNMFKRIS